MATAISFFTGAGGLDLGLHQVDGFDIRLSVEIEETYCETLRVNNPYWNVVQGDIMEFNRKRVYEAAGLDSSEDIDLIVGGSPCQSFSTAGKRLAFEDPRGQAMIKFARIVSEVKPKVFLLENVRGLLSAALKHRPLDQRGEDFPPLDPEEEPGSALKYLLSQIQGYRINYKLLNAADYGVPQKRERVFFVGVREDLKKEFIFPETTHQEKGLNGKRSWVPVSTVLSPLREIEHHYMSYSQERLKYMQLIPKGGGNWRNLPEELVKEAMGGAYTSGGGKVGFYRRIHFDRPAPTLLTSPAQKSTNIGHPFEDRPLSIEEYLAIQEFPQGYKVAGSLAKQYTQIGNAVPIRLARILGKSILDLIKEESFSFENNKNRIMEMSV